MATHNDLGKWGEQQAVEFLQRAGYEILETNWRFSKAEVDIIAQDSEVLVFVEVKTRSDDFFGRPEMFVSAKKESFLAKAASHFMDKIGHSGEIRFDVISILKKGGSVEVQHFADAFFPGLK